MHQQPQYIKDPPPCAIHGENTIGDEGSTVTFPNKFIPRRKKDFIGVVSMSKSTSLKYLALSE